MFPIGCSWGTTTGHRRQKCSEENGHCTKLQGRFNDYFPEKHRSDDWVRDPFAVDMESATLPSNKESQLVELSCDRILKKKFSPSFGAVLWWLSVHSLPPMQSKSCYHSALPISVRVASQLRGQLKTKQRNRPDVEHHPRVALSTIDPRIWASCQDQKASPVFPLAPPNSVLLRQPRDEVRVKCYWTVFIIECCSVGYVSPDRVSLLQLELDSWNLMSITSLTCIYVYVYICTCVTRLKPCNGGSPL